MFLREAKILINAHVKPNVKKYWA